MTVPTSPASIDISTVRPTRRPFMRSAALLTATLTVALSIGLGIPANGQEAVDPCAGASELARIGGALDQLVVLMEGQSTASQTELLMRRLEIAVAALAPDESALRRQREMVDKAQQELDQYQQSAQLWLSQLEAQDDDGTAEERIRQQRASYETQLENFEQRRWMAEQRVLDLEADLDPRRAVVSALAAEVDRRLGIE